MNGYKLLGYVVWRACKWHLRRLLRSRRVLASGGLAFAGGLTVLALLVRRLSG